MNLVNKPRFHIRGKISFSIIFLLLALAFLGCKRYVKSETDSNAISEPALVEVKVSQFHMGMMVDLIVWAPSKEQGQAACAKAFERIRQLNEIFSDYEPDSELSRFCRNAGNGPMKISKELFTVLSLGKELSQLSHGRYDVTAAPVIRLWRKARREKKLPDAEVLAHALTLTGFDKMLLDASAQTAELRQAGMLLDLGSIAKGYIGDEAIRTLRALGCPVAAFIAGGDMVFGDAPPGTKGWPVRPAKTDLAEMRLSHCGFSVSGDTVQFVEIDGKRYSHVIDAATGEALTGHTMCVVIAPSGLVSDPLSTIGTIVPEDEFNAVFCKRFPEAKTWVFTSE